MSSSFDITPQATVAIDAVVPPVPLLTAEEYGALPDLGYPNELVMGRIVRLNQPYPRHGQVCLNVGAMLREFVRSKKLGHVTSNDSGILTKRDPDTVRGADVAYFSFARISDAKLPTSYSLKAPELVIEVRSRSDRWKDITEKVAEYLSAGVLNVCVVDEETASAYLYAADQAVKIFTAGDALTLPDVLPGFSVMVGELFE